jgi:hypothetical protein
MLTSSGTWLQLKAFCMTAPIALSLAFAGAAWLLRRRRLLGMVGLGAGGLVALGVLYGNALQYHQTSLADYARLDDLKQVNARFAGQGPALFPNFDEFGEYILRDARGSGIVNPWRGRSVGNRTAKPGLQTVRDTDEYDLRFVQSFRLIIRRRDPLMSRPPSNWSLAAVTRDYEVWRRAGDPRTVAAHYPLNARPSERTPAFCRRVSAAADGVGAGARIAYAVPKPAIIGAPPVPGSFAPNWELDGEVLRAGSAGRWLTRFDVRTPGRYRVFLRGSIGRTVTLSVDGRRIGAVRWRESYPGQYSSVTTLQLDRGRHELEVLRGGGSLLPGTGNDPSGTTTTIGPVVFDPTFEREVVRTAPASRLRSICASDTRMDWLEVLRPSAG